MEKSWYCYSCYDAAKRELKASKKAEKAAKQAAREEEEHESGGGSSSSAELPSGCVKIVGMILAFLVVCGILGMLFCKNEDANDPAVKMAKWEEHLEKRRAAFAEGLSEEGVEARGLKNFTWEEWQNRSKAKAAEKVEDISEKYRVHMNKRMSFLNSGHTDAEAHAVGLDDYTFEAFKQNYKNIKYKTLEEIRQSAANPTSPVTISERSAVPTDVTDRVKAEAEARAKSEAEAKAKREAAIKEKMETRARMKAEAEVKARAKADAEAKARAKAQAAAKARAAAAAKAEAEARARAEDRVRAEARAKAEAEAKAKKDVPKVAAADAVGGQQNGDRTKASKDSKGIAIVVTGKGKTNDAAMRSAIHKAVFRAVSRWVDSKEQMEEKREEVKSVVMSLAEGDVNKFEVQDTQQQGGACVLKMKVYISKKKIAPKFEKVFPDVFGND